MKEGIHPAIREVVFQDTITGSQYIVASAAKTELTATVNGKAYPLVKIDVSSSSHPFYTGNQRILDIAGRVEKFGTKYGKGGVAGLLKLKK